MNAPMQIARAVSRQRQNLFVSLITLAEAWLPSPATAERARAMLEVL